MISLRPAVVPPQERTGEALADLVDTGSRLAHEARAELEPEEVETDDVKAKNGG